MDAGTRELIVPAFPAYIVAYRLIGSEAIEVVRIWHGAQDRWN
jgi:plasmid stabilization system protein ParE